MYNATSNTYLQVWSPKNFFDIMKSQKLPYISCFLYCHLENCTYLGQFKRIFYICKLYFSARVRTALLTWSCPTVSHVPYGRRRGRNGQLPHARRPGPGLRRHRQQEQAEQSIWLQAHGANMNKYFFIFVYIALNLWLIELTMKCKL